MYMIAAQANEANENTLDDVKLTSQLCVLTTQCNYSFRTTIGKISNYIPKCHQIPGLFNFHYRSINPNVAAAGVIYVFKLPCLHLHKKAFPLSSMKLHLT